MGWGRGCRCLGGGLLLGGSKASWRGCLEGGSFRGQTCESRVGGGLWEVVGWSVCLDGSCSRLLNGEVRHNESRGNI